MKKLLFASLCLLVGFQKPVLAQFNALPFLSGGFGDIEISADYLYWSTNYNLPLTVDVDSNHTSMVTPGLDLTIEDIDFDVVRSNQNWTSGFRVGLGWSAPCSSWDIRAIYTNFYNNSTLHRTGLFDSASTDSEAKLRLNYNIGDLEFGTKFCLGEHAILRPFAGVRVGFLEQKHNVLFAGDFTPITLPINLPILPLEQPATVRLHQKLWAVGPRIGLDTQWGNFWGVSILGNVSSSLLYGKNCFKFNIQTVAMTAGLVIDETITNLQIKDRDYHLFPTLQMFIGLGYKYNFFNMNTIQIKAGWETNFWWEASNTLAAERALSLQGLTVDLSFNF